MLYGVTTVLDFSEEFIKKQRSVIFSGQQLLKVVYCSNLFCFSICAMTVRETKIILKT